MKRNNWIVVAASGLVALVLGVAMYFRDDTKEEAKDDHMAKMREAKAKKAAAVELENKDSE